MRENHGSPSGYKEKLRANLRNPANVLMLRIVTIGLIVCICIDPLFLAATYAFRYIPGSPADVADGMFRSSLLLFGGFGLLAIPSVIASLWMLRVANEGVPK
jgi:hypothetical protein